MQLTVIVSLLQIYKTTYTAFLVFNAIYVQLLFLVAILLCPNLLYFFYTYF